MKMTIKPVLASLVIATLAVSCKKTEEKKVVDKTELAKKDKELEKLKKETAEQLAKQKAEFEKLHAEEKAKTAEQQTQIATLEANKDLITDVSYGNLIKELGADAIAFANSEKTTNEQITNKEIYSKIVALNLANKQLIADQDRKIKELEANKDLITENAYAILISDLSSDAKLFSDFHKELNPSITNKEIYEKILVLVKNGKAIKAEIIETYKNANDSRNKINKFILNITQNFDSSVYPTISLIAEALKNFEVKNTINEPKDLVNFIKVKTDYVSYLNNLDLLKILIEDSSLSQYAFDIFNEKLELNNKEIFALLNIENILFPKNVASTDAAIVKSNQAFTDLIDILPQITDFSDKKVLKLNKFVNDVKEKVKLLDLNELKIVENASATEEAKLRTILASIQKDN
jgi:hypothetical protein